MPRGAGRLCHSVDAGEPHAWVLLLLEQINERGLGGLLFGRRNGHLDGDDPHEPLGMGTRRLDDLLAKALRPRRREPDERGDDRLLAGLGRLEHAHFVLELHHLRVLVVGQVVRKRRVSRLAEQFLQAIEPGGQPPREFREVPGLEHKALRDQAIRTRLRLGEEHLRDLDLLVGLAGRGKERAKRLLGIAPLISLELRLGGAARCEREDTSDESQRQRSKIHAKRSGGAKTAAMAAEEVRRRRDRGYPSQRKVYPPQGAGSPRRPDRRGGPSAPVEGAPSEEPSAAPPGRVEDQRKKRISSTLPANIVSKTSCGPAFGSATGCSVLSFVMTALNRSYVP